MKFQNFIILFMFFFNACDNPLTQDAELNCVYDLEGFYDDCNICSEGNTGHEANSDNDCLVLCDEGVNKDVCGMCGGDCDSSSLCNQQDICGICFGNYISCINGLLTYPGFVAGQDQWDQCTMYDGNINYDPVECFDEGWPSLECNDTNCPNYDNCMLEGTEIAMCDMACEGTNFNCFNQEATFCEDLGYSACVPVIPKPNIWRFKEMHLWNNENCSGVPHYSYYDEICDNDNCYYYE